MFDIDKLVRENIRHLKPYSSARDEFEGAASVWLDANENPFNNGLNRYPDPHQLDLKWAIAREKNLHPDQIFLGNGSDEAIDLLFRAFCEPGEDKILLFEPTYGMYQVSAGIQNTGIVRLSLTDEFQLPVLEAIELIEKRKPKLTFICSPNNPTGNLLSAEDIEALLEANSGLVVIDEAYIDFTDSPSWVTRLDEFPNLFVMQTFSKARAKAGIRLGMGFGSKEVIQILNRIKPPYNISELTQAEALKSVQVPSPFPGLEIIKEQRERLLDELPRTKEVTKVYPTESNFILAEVNDAGRTYKDLVNAGIVVRDRSGQVPNCLRITVGTPDENDTLLSILNGVQKEVSTKDRTATVQRTTKETDIQVSLNLDGKGKSSIQTGLGFFDHMLDQLSKHGGIDLNIQVNGDLEIDEHHTIEDTALALGEAFKQALADKRGIERYGFLLPMDETLAQVAIDFGGRPWLVWEADFKREKIGEMPTEMFYHFFKSFSDTAVCNLNIKVEGENEHHMIEAIFKAFARAIKMAIRKGDSDELPTTKGVL